MALRSRTKRIRVTAIGSLPNEPTRVSNRTSSLANKRKEFPIPDDADNEPPLRLLAEIDWEAVKNDLRAWVAALTESDDF
jgi:hypothetical protein